MDNYILILPTCAALGYISAMPKRLSSRAKPRKQPAVSTTHG